jgi:hypothetical protein
MRRFASMTESRRSKQTSNSSSVMLPGRRRSCEGITYHCMRTVQYENCTFMFSIVYPRARFAKDVSLLTIWPKDTHRQGLGVD